MHSHPATMMHEWNALSADIVSSLNSSSIFLLILALSEQFSESETITSNVLGLSDDVAPKEGCELNDQPLVVHRGPILNQELGHLARLRRLRERRVGRRGDEGSLEVRRGWRRGRR